MKHTHTTPTSGDLLVHVDTYFYVYGIIMYKMLVIYTLALDIINKLMCNLFQKMFVDEHNVNMLASTY